LTRLVTSLEEELAAAKEGYSLNRAAAHQLIEAEGTLLDRLLQAAAHLRDKRSGKAITYSRKVFIPLTNLCRDACGYCTFVRRPGDPLAHTMTPEEVLAVAVAGKAAGCKEALFSLGDKPELRHKEHRAWLAQYGYQTTTEYLRDMCRMVLEKTGLLPHSNPGALSYADLAMLKPYNASMGMMLETISYGLLKKGQAHHRCPDKVPSVRLQTLEDAGKLQIPFTTGLLIGIGETRAERVEALFAIKEIQERYGHIQEVIIQNFRVKEDIIMRDAPEPEIIEMWRLLAVARLIFGSEVTIQAPPNLAPDVYKTYIPAGLNDWGGVSPVTKDHINPERAWPKLTELRTATESKGYQLRERLAVAPTYALEPEKWLPPLVQPLVKELIDGVGLVKPDKEQWLKATPLPF
jgi:7,8-didemethyl-8-hydroxy-5-deazariboflavin synthase CofG subunit